MKKVENGQIRTLIHSVRHVVCVCDVLANSVFLYPAVPKQIDVDEIQKLKLVISRHGKRCAYYAANFIDNYLKILNNVLQNDSGAPSMRLIEDSIFFDFDAFAFSCKSIVEGNIVKLGKKFPADIRSDFENYSHAKLKNFIKTFLIPIRDEAVHLNNFGTAIGSIIHVGESNTLFIQTNFSNDIDLIEMFSRILEEIKGIILNISKCIIRHESVLWGKPNMSFVFRCGDQELTLSEIFGSDFKEQF